MRKKEVLRFLAYAAAAAVAALLIALLALRALFPPETVKSMAVERLSAALGRQVRVAAVSIGLRGADLRGLEISQRPDFSAGTLASVERLRLSARWLPMLLEKRFEVGSISAEGWTVDLTPASFAAQAGAPPPSQGPAPSPAGGKAADFSVSRLRLEGGLLRYTDASKGLSVRAADARAEFSDLALDRPFPLDLSFSLQVRREGAPTLSGKFALEGRLDPARGEPERMSLEAALLRFDLAGLPVSVRGSVKDFTAPRLDLRWEAGLPRTVTGKLLASALGWTGLGGAIRLKAEKDAMTLEALSMEREGFSLTASGTVSGLRTRKPKPDFKLSLDARIPSLPAAAVKTVWPSFPDGAALPAASLRTRGRWQGERSLSFPSAELLIGSLAAKVRGGVSWEGPLRLDLALETGPFEVSEFTPFFPRASAYALAGKTRLKLHARGPAASPAAAGEILPEKLGLTVSSQTFTDLEGAVRFSSGSVDAKLKGRWNGAEAQLSVDAKGLSEGSLERSLRVEGSLGEVDLAAFSAAPAGPVPAAPPAEGAPPKPAPPLKSSGRLSIGRLKHPNFETRNTELAWDLRGLSKDRSALDGWVKLRTSEGRFENLGLLASENPLLKTALLPFLILQKVSGLVKIPLFPAFDRVSFKEITGDYAFEKGVMTVKESHLDGSEAYVAVTGKADLAKDELDLRLSTKLGTQVGLRLSGPVGITVKGSVSDPKVSVDPLSIIKQPGVDKVIEGGKKMLEEGGKKLLEGIFKK